MELSGIIAVATAAVREAEDGLGLLRPDRQARRPASSSTVAASGSEEARLAAQGVSSAGPTPRVSSATWAAPRWSSPASTAGRSTPAAPRRHSTNHRCGLQTPRDEVAAHEPAAGRRLLCRPSRKTIFCRLNRIHVERSMRGADPGEGRRRKSMARLDGRNGSRKG